MGPDLDRTDGILERIFPKVDFEKTKNSKGQKGMKILPSRQRVKGNFHICLIRIDKGLDKDRLCT